MVQHLAGYDTTAPTLTTCTWASPPHATGGGSVPEPGSKEQGLATEDKGTAPGSMGNVHGRGMLGEFESESTIPCALTEAFIPEWRLW